VNENNRWIATPGLFFSSVTHTASLVFPLPDIPIIEKSALQGRTWIDAPPDLRQGEPTSYIPKTCVHTWSGHTKGVHKIQWFPGTGHLLLSASMDGKVKIWDVYNSRKCMRTYSGHTKPVRDVSFSADGKTFTSAGYDKVSPHPPTINPMLHTQIEPINQTTDRPTQEAAHNAKDAEKMTDGPGPGCETLGHGDRHVRAVVGCKGHTFLRQDPSQGRVRARGVLQQEHCAVGPEATSRRVCTRVRAAPGVGQHHHVYRRVPQSRFDRGRQEAVCLGVRYRDGTDEARIRAMDAFDACCYCR
jgi:hypothetical protein